MKFKFAVCFRTSKHSMAVWVTEEAENAREAVENVMREFTVSEIVGVYKEQVRWKWE